MKNIYKIREGDPTLYWRTTATDMADIETRLIYQRTHVNNMRI